MTATTGAVVPGVPVLFRSRHSSRAAVSSVRASTRITSALPVCKNEETSVGADPYGVRQQRQGRQNGNGMRIDGEEK